MSEAAFALCAQRVEAGDPDRFAAVMATPAAMRGPLWAVYAANLEIARAPWASAEPLVAEMRLQWWIDALEKRAEGGAEPPHEIGPALAALPEAALRALARAAEARRADCWSDPFEHAAMLWDYLAASSGEVYAAAGAVLGAKDIEALRTFGAAAGLAQWLVALPELRARGRLDLAGDEAGLADLAAEGLVRLDAARAGLRASGRAERLAALPGWEARAVLRRAAGDPARIAKGTLRGSEFTRRLGLLRAALQA